MATLPPQIHDKVEVIETIKAPEKPRDKTIWTELPLSYVHTFVTERKDKVVIIRRGIGGEVGFHYRQGHTRRYLLKDGTILDRWFATTKVRADKEAAQGGIPVGGAKKIIT